MRLIRFKALRDREDLNRLKRVIEQKEFYCSTFLDLNDPMEGVFTTIDISNVDNIFSGKNQYKICSFTGENGLRNPLLWGYYANGFKGVAIEIEVNKISDIREINGTGEGIIKVKYLSQNRFDKITEDVVEILSRKLKNWNYEEEYRYLVKSNEPFHKIGEIIKVHFGNPYGNLVNKNSILENSSKYRTYLKLRTELEKVCDNKNVPFENIKLSKR